MENKTVITILGLKWWDKPNGNTYFNTVIVLPDGHKAYTGFQYGYDNQYYHEAKNTLVEMGYNLDDYIIVDLGSVYTTKAKAKRGDLDY